MANYTELKAAVNAVIKTNGNQEITGQVLQNTLNTIISSVGANAQFAGVATASTNPGTPDQNVFYLAVSPGTYANFDGLEIKELSVIRNNASGTWTATGLSTMTFQYFGGDFAPKSMTRTGVNIADWTEYIPGFYFNWTNQQLTVNASYRVSPYIPIVAGTTYYMYAVQQLIWFDANHNQIGFEINIGERAFTAPTGAAFVILNVSTALSSLYFATVPRSSTTNRFFRVLTETSRFPRFPWDDKYPMNISLIENGMNNVLINGYVDIPHVEGQTYNLTVGNKENKTLSLYRKPKDVLATPGNITFLATFAGTLIEGSRYYLMLPTSTTNVGNSWFIADLDAMVATYYNIYDYDGAAVSPKIFKGGIWSQFPGMDIKLDVSNLQLDWTSVFQYSPILNNAQSWEENVFTAQNGSSTFSGWGSHIGVRKNFNAAEICVINRGTAPITTVRVAMFIGEYNGTKIGDNTIAGLNIAPGEKRFIAVKLMTDLYANANNDVMFCQYWCDQLVTRWGYNGTYPYTPTNGYLADVYSTNGNMTYQIPGTGTVGYPIYFRVGEYAGNYTLKDEQIQDIKNRIGIIPTETVKISLPTNIYATVGDTLQLFFRGMIQAVDPYRYDILVACTKGKKYPRYFEYTPTATDVGTVTFTVNIKDDYGNVIAQKQCNLITNNVVKSPTTALKVACFGDSLTNAGIWCAEAHRRLIGSGGTPAGKGLTNIDFVGSKMNGVTGYFGAGGWRWNDYTTSGRPAYRFQVSGVSTLAVGAIYTNNGNTFTVMEVNVTSGTGEILCSVPALAPAPSASGTLTKSSGTGDATITYSSVAQDSQNPLWDYGANKMTFIPYANNYGGGKIDVVYTLLSWNGQTAGKTDFSDVLAQVKIFADTLHAEFPNAKLKILGIQVPSINGGMGANYGATGTGYADGYGMVRTALNQNDAYQEFANQTAYSGFVEFVNVSTQFDSEFNMPDANKAVNTRNSDNTELIGTSGVHPDNNGYLSIGDVVYRNIVAKYCQ